MFEVGWSEILVIVIVLIVVVGPKDLPKMLRAFGKATTKFRATAGEFRRQFDEALKEAELDDVRDIINDAKSLDPRSDIRKVFDPVRTIGEEIRSSLKDATVNGQGKCCCSGSRSAGGHPVATAGDGTAWPLRDAAAKKPDKVKPKPGTPQKPKPTGCSAKKPAAPKDRSEKAEPVVAAAKPAKTPAKRTAKPRAKTGDTGTNLEQDRRRN